LFSHAVVRAHASMPDDRVPASLLAPQAKPKE
jgi:hypothetical protein